MVLPNTLIPPPQQRMSWTPYPKISVWVPSLEYVRPLFADKASNSFLDAPLQHKLSSAPVGNDKFPPGPPPQNFICEWFPLLCILVLEF